MGRFEFERQRYPSEIKFLHGGQFDIPTTTSMDGWKQIPIQESGQQLVLLDNLSSRIKSEPRYHINGVQNALDKIYLREEVAERLIQAANLLPKDYSLVVFDAYRPLHVQEEIFNSYRHRLIDEHPDKDFQTVTRMTETYVSLPSGDTAKPSPHSTGGAIDLSILTSDQTLLEMGTEWDSFDISSRTDFYRETDKTYHKNRLLLYKIMTIAGFTNYPEEWWHYDFGNQFWGHLSGNYAIYGIVEGGDFYDRKTAR